MVNMINTLLSAELTNTVGKLLELLYSNIGNFGWTVVVFSILLKLVLSPLDIWQRVSMRKQSKKMNELRPKLEKLEKQYRNNPDLLRQKQYELQRSANINILSSCLPLIVTMVIFFVVFGGFRALVTYENELIVEELDKVYVTEILDYNYNLLTDEDKATIDATNSKYDWTAMQRLCDTKYVDRGVEKVVGLIEYGELEKLDKDAFAQLKNKLAAAYDTQLERTSWLWVKNVFKSDTGTTIIPDDTAFTSSGVGGIGASLDKLNVHTSYSNLVGPAYNKYAKSGTWDFKNWNGYFILPLLSLLTCFLSTYITQKSTPQTAMGTKEQAAQQQKTMKMMNYMMPVMLAVFAMMYSAAFAIYYLMSNVLTTILTLTVNGIDRIIQKRKEASEPVIIRR